MTTLQALITLVTLGWALISWNRGQRATALGSLAMSAVAGAAWFADATEFSPWIEGGYGMHVLTLVGGYAIGSAVAARVSGKSAPRLASMIGLAFVGLLAFALFREGVNVTEEAIGRANPADAEVIRQAARSELMRLPQLSVMIGAIAAALLFGPRRRNAQRLESEGTLPRSNTRAGRSEFSALS
ncbi:MAG: hypothetical protein QM817_11895 [Archangium sp.]